MKRLPVLAVTAVFVVSAGGALAQPVSTITDKSGIVGTDGKKFKAADGRICKRMVITGSRMPQKKVCKTADEWRLQEEEAKKELGDQLRRNGYVNKVGGAEGG